MSRVVEERAMLDAGLKALSVDSGMPRMWDMPGVEFVGASDEHGKLLVEVEGITPGDDVGEVVLLADEGVRFFDLRAGLQVVLGR